MSLILYLHNIIINNTHPSKYLGGTDEKHVNRSYNQYNIITLVITRLGKEHIIDFRFFYYF